MHIQRNTNKNSKTRTGKFTLTREVEVITNTIKIHKEFAADSAEGRISQVGHKHKESTTKTPIIHNKSDVITSADISAQTTDTAKQKTKLGQGAQNGTILQKYVDIRTSII